MLVVVARPARRVAEQPVEVGDHRVARPSLTRIARPSRPIVTTSGWSVPSTASAHQRRPRLVPRHAAVAPRRPSRRGSRRWPPSCRPSRPSMPAPIAWRSISSDLAADAERVQARDRLARPGGVPSEERRPRRSRERERGVGVALLGLLEPFVASGGEAAVQHRDPGVEVGRRHRVVGVADRPRSPRGSARSRRPCRRCARSVAMTDAGKPRATRCSAVSSMSSKCAICDACHVPFAESGSRPRRRCR